MEDENLQSAGRVKWFDPARGFGFILCDDVAGDVLIHANVLRNFGLNSIAEGAEIRFEVQKSDRGHQAVRILEVTPPETSLEMPADIAGLSEAELADLALVPARVKWFNGGKGFGFANVFGFHDDVFIHADVVRRSGMATLQPGEAVAIKVIDGARGRMAVALLAWDSALGG